MEPERRLIPAHELRHGQSVYIEPRAADVSRGHKLDNIDAGGQWAKVNDYIHGCVARGAVLAWSGAPALTAAEAAAPVGAASAEESDAS